MTVPLTTVAEFLSEQAATRCDAANRVVMAGQSPATVARAGIATAGRPDDTVTATVLPRFTFSPAGGDWVRICPEGTVIDVGWPVTTTWNWSWRSLAWAWAWVRPMMDTSL